MRTLVYRYGLQPPTDNSDLVAAQLRGAHRYRNDLTWIERERRKAVRALLCTDEIREAESVVRAATKSSRKAALKLLAAARKKEVEAKHDEIARINDLADELNKGAYALAECAWGTRLDIQSAAQKQRAMRLYDETGLEPGDPKFRRTRLDVRGQYPEGQLAVQCQGGLRVGDAWTGTDTRVRLTRSPNGHRNCLLQIRVGSDGREPVWATFPDLVLSREMPDAGEITWVRVSHRVRGPMSQWSCEITVRADQPHPHALDVSLSGAIAVECVWHPDGDSLRAADYRDSRGNSGKLVMPPRIVGGLRKASDIRSVRDTLRAAMAPRLIRALHESRDALPVWLAEAKATIEYWKSRDRFIALVKMWRAEKCDAARAAYDLLQEWELRDNHLYEYETGARTNSLRARLDWYRNVAAQWSREYRYAVVDNRVLSREARWGEDSEMRFLLGPSELRTCLEHAFGYSCTVHPYRERLNEDDERDFCERAIDAWNAGGAREAKNANRIKHGQGGAWAARKKKKADRAAENGAAREVAANGAE